MSLRGRSFRSDRELIHLTAYIRRETVWKIIEGALIRVVSGTRRRNGTSSHLLATRGTPSWGLSRFSKQSLGYGPMARIKPKITQVSDAPASHQD